jgi:transcriptional regulator with GAF, ATPase, and Fis domain
MIAGNLKYTGELKKHLQTIKTWPFEIKIEATDPAVRWTECEGSSSMLNEIAAKALQMLQLNSCQILVLSSGNGFKCQAMQMNRSASSHRQSTQRDYYRVQDFLHKVILSDSPVLIDHSDHFIRPEDRYLLRIHPSESLILIPLRIETEPVGLFMLAFESYNLSIGSVNQALVFADQASKAIHREGLFFSEEVSIIELVMVLAEALRTWDQPTSLHSRRITVLAEKTAIKLGCSFHEIQSIRSIKRA